MSAPRIITEDEALAHYRASTRHVRNHLLRLAELISTRTKLECTGPTTGRGRREIRLRHDALLGQGEGVQALLDTLADVDRAL